MNIQAMMKQAQKMQKDMMKEKEELDKKEFSISKSFVEIKATGDKKITSLKINLDNIDKDDMESVEDLLIVGINELISNIDKESEKNMSKYSKGLPGLF